MIGSIIVNQAYIPCLSEFIDYHQRQYIINYDLGVSVFTYCPFLISKQSEKERREDGGWEVKYHLYADIAGIKSV